jgi:hypothetical protein
LLITFLQLADLPKVVFDPASEMLLLRLFEPEFVFQPQADTLYLGFKAEPDVLLIVILFFEKQPEGFFGTQLGDASEVFNPEAIQHLSSFQRTFAQAQRALHRLCQQSKPPFRGVLSQQIRSSPTYRGTLVVVHKFA